jgi:hypothetical protein
MEQHSPAYLNNKSNPSAEATPVLSFISMQKARPGSYEAMVHRRKSKKLVIHKEGIAMPIKTLPC